MIKVYYIISEYEDYTIIHILQLTFTDKNVKREKHYWPFLVAKYTIIWKQVVLFS
jgi:hypothetical protein